MTKAKVEVGQVVTFKDAEGVEQIDIINYIDDEVIEGKKFDLTYVDFTITDFTKVIFTA